MTVNGELFFGEMNMANHMKQAWDGYVKQCMPKNPSEIQYTETKRAFYGGGYVALTASRDRDLAESVALEIAEFLKQEVMRVQQNRSPVKADSNLPPETRRQVQVDYLRCQATGYDDESCRAVLSRFDEAKDVAMAMFSMLQGLYPGDNPHAIQCTLVAMHSFIEVIKEMNY